MCEVLKDKAPSTQSEEDPKKALNFKRILIAKCQREFYRDYMEDLNKDKYESDLAAAESEDKRKEIQSEWEEQERRARKRSLGNIRFIGELYKLKMLCYLNYSQYSSTLSQQQTLARDWSSISLIFHSLSIKRPELIMLCLTFKGNQSPEQTIRVLPNFIEMMPAVIC